MPDAVTHLGAVSRAYQSAVAEYPAITDRAARAEATYRSERAKAVLRNKTNAERMSQSEAETRADADDHIADLLMERLVSAAVAEAAKQALRQLQSQIEVGRSTVASERNVDQLHAQGAGGV